MPLINCEINLVLPWSSVCVITNSIGARTFSITHTKLYVPVVSLSTKNNPKLLEQFTCGLKKQLTGININQNDQQKEKTHI